MRELKFRAWDKLDKEFAHNIDCLLDMSVAERVFALDDEGGELIIEQYTGLKDKNGKEIYEGDIVEALVNGVWETGRNSISFGKAKWKLEVIYNGIRFMDVFKVIGSKNNPDRIYYLFDKELSDLEVVGNIHENPELSEQVVQRSTK